MKTVGEALEAILAGFSRLGPERVGLVHALDRVSAEDVHARLDSPAFDNSAMDGYAVRAADVPAAGSRLPIRGESRAGHPSADRLAEGSAMRIYTGAVMPPDADSVVIQENVTREGDEAHFLEPARAAANVRPQGSNLRAGAVALPAGSVVGPGEIALLASQDYASLDVTRRPRVAILATGDELRDIGAPDRPGSIVNSNAYGLAAQVQRAGADPWVLPPVADSLDETTARIRQALKADVLLCSGGVSVGDYDIVREAFRQAGVTLDFWKVAMKPGKPVSFGMHHDTPVIGLPGNPVSTFVTFELFVRPGLRRMLGDRRPHLTCAQVHLSHPHRHKPGRLELARARIHSAGASRVAELLSRQGSDALPALVGVDALVALPGDVESFDTQTPLDALFLQGPGSAASPFRQ